jgi:Uma2 family endonuclease
MSTVEQLATIEDLARHPGRCELIDGEIIHMAPAGFEHGFVVANIARILGGFVHERKLGRVLAGDPGFILDQRSVRAPDIAFLDHERVAQAPAQGYMPFVPNLAVEVVSPGDTHTEVVAKARLWIQRGVKQVWVVDPPSQTMEIYTAGKPWVGLDASHRLDGGDVLPGFSCEVAQFFA